MAQRVHSITLMQLRSFRVEDQLRIPHVDQEVTLSIYDVDDDRDCLIPVYGAEGEFTHRSALVTFALDVAPVDPTIKLPQVRHTYYMRPSPFFVEKQLPSFVSKLWHCELESDLRTRMHRVVQYAAVSVGERHPIGVAHVVLHETRSGLRAHYLAARPNTIFRSEQLLIQQSLRWGPL